MDDARRVEMLAYIILREEGEIYSWRECLTQAREILELPEETPKQWAQRLHATKAFTIDMLADASKLAFPPNGRSRSMIALWINPESYRRQLDYYVKWRREKKGKV